MSEVVSAPSDGLYKAADSFTTDKIRGKTISNPSGEHNSLKFHKVRQNVLGTVSPFRTLDWVLLVLDRSTLPHFNGADRCGLHDNQSSERRDTTVITRSLLRLPWRPRPVH